MTTTYVIQLPSYTGPRYFIYSDFDNGSTQYLRDAAHFTTREEAEATARRKALWGICEIVEVTADAKLDEITRRSSCFGSFQELLDAPGHYRPTILITEPQHLTLALAYDAAQKARGDDRRCYTGSTFPKVGDTVLLHALNGWRIARIDKVGPKRVTLSFTTKSSIRAAHRVTQYLAARVVPELEPGETMTKIEPRRNRKLVALAALIPTADRFTHTRTWKLR